MKPIFPVLINNQQYFVYDIDKSVKAPHNGFNDTPSTWWLFYNTDLFILKKPPAWQVVVHCKSG